MSCLPCFNTDEDSEISPSKRGQPGSADPPPPEVQTFNFRELAMATKNFRQECLLGEGGFGRVFKGTLQDSEQVVAVKQLDRNGMQENQEFTAEVLKLSLLHHTNLVNLIGYCADGDQRVLVYEYVSMGSLEQHLLGDTPDKKPLDWDTRMKIASGAAQGLEYLHEKANPPVIYGDFQPSNVLLNDDFEPKLSDVGLSKLGAGDAANQSSSRKMGTYGYSAPEYSKGGEVTLKSDIYSFGVVLLELITGRRAVDTTRPTDEQNLVTWAQPFFRDPKRFSEMADPTLNKQFPATSLNQAVGIAAMCIQDEPMVRPLISDVTAVLSCISMIPNAPQPQKMENENQAQEKPPAQQHKDSDDSSTSSDSDDAQSRGAGDQQSVGDHDSDEEVSQGESGSSSESSDQEEENKERKNTKRVKTRQQSSRKARTKGVSSQTKGVSAESRATVVTFKEPSKSSRYKASGKPETKGESSSSSDSSSESEDEGGLARAREDDAAENGLGSSRQGSESSSPERAKRRRN